MQDKTYTSNILDYATFGIDQNIAADAKVEVNLRDLVFVAQTLQELIQFFHNRDHYPTLEALHDYLGTRDSKGAFNLLSAANYEVMDRMIPKLVEDLYDEGAFDGPDMPFYFKPHE